MKKKVSRGVCTWVITSSEARPRGESQSGRGLDYLDLMARRVCLQGWHHRACRCQKLTSNFPLGTFFASTFANILIRGETNARHKENIEEYP